MSGSAMQAASQRSAFIRPAELLPLLLLLPPPLLLLPPPLLLLLLLLPVKCRC
jgi:hypothetical protein